MDQTYFKIYNLPVHLIHNSCKLPLSSSKQVNMRNQSMPLPHKYHLMMVEDNPMMRKFLNTYFHKKFRVTLAEDGFEALALLKKEEIPDLIVADIQMPNMDGFQLLDQLNESIYHKQIPVIILSGNNKSSYRIRCLEKGAVDFLSKPFHPRELELRIINHLSTSGLKNNIKESLMFS